MSVRSSIPAPRAWIRTTSTVTGSQNNLNLSSSGPIGNLYVEWSGASDATITGIDFGVYGQSASYLFFKNTGSKVAYFAHNSGSSDADNRFTNLVTSGSTPVAPGGWISYVFNGTNWVLVSHEQGAYIDVAFDSANFSLNGDRTLTIASGDQTTYSWKLVGRSLHVVWVLKTMSISGGAGSTVFRIAIPNSYTSTLEGLSVSVYWLIAGTAVVGYVLVTAAGTLLNTAKLDTSDIGTGADNISNEGQTWLEIT